MRWPRLSLVFAVTAMLSVVARPSFAQKPEPQEAAATTLTEAPFAAGYVCGVQWLGSHDDRRKPKLDFDGPWQGPGAMIIEQRLATQVLRSWWPEHIADPRAAAILDGLTQYLQACAIEHVFDNFYLRTAHSVESRAYLGGHVIWSVPTLRVSRYTAASRDRYGAVFESLERWIGMPALQSALFAVAQLPADHLTRNDIVTTISNAAGQDLSWVFDAAESGVSYAVVKLAPAQVTVARNGAGIFSGRTAPREGGFQSGDALKLKVVFADGTTSTTTWDGRDQSRTFEFQGASPIVAAYLDPDRVNALDRNYLDNAIVAPMPTNVPVRKWAARWIVWLQHTMLSYGSLA